MPDKDGPCQEQEGLCPCLEPGLVTDEYLPHEGRVIAPYGLHGWLAFRECQLCGGSGRPRNRPVEAGTSHCDSRRRLPKRGSSFASRRAFAKESFQTAAECIGPLSPKMALFAITRGQFSMIDAILACLDQTGPAAVSVWTWVIAPYEMDCVERLLRDGRLTTARLIIDIAARERNMALIQRWATTFGMSEVRFVTNHAKIATIESSAWRLLLRGSMNLNFNPRFEQFDLTEGGPDFDLVRKLEDELPCLDLDCSNAEAYAATGLRNAWSDQTLKLFSGASPWRK